MGLKTFDILATLVLNLIQYGCSDHILSCNETLLTACPVNQLCNASLHLCECQKGFVLVGDECELPADDPGSQNNTTIAIVTVFTMALLITGIVLVVRKYNIVEYIRQKIDETRNQDIMYEDVMIGDDPPLSP